MIRATFHLRCATFWFLRGSADVAFLPRRMAEVKKEETKKADDKTVDKDLMSKFGEHTGITCDGCEVIPVIGFRYRCTKCKDPQGNLAHDICEDCHNAFQNGKFKNENKLNKYVNPSPTDHHFEIVAENKAFKPIVMGGAAAKATASTKAAKKQKPNDPCACGSKKKFKACCALKE